MHDTWALSRFSFTQMFSRIVSLPQLSFRSLIPYNSQQPKCMRVSILCEASASWSCRHGLLSYFDIDTLQLDIAYTALQLLFCTRLQKCSTTTLLHTTVHMVRLYKSNLTFGHSRQYTGKHIILINSSGYDSPTPKAWFAMDIIDTAYSLLYQMSHHQ